MNPKDLLPEGDSLLGLLPLLLVAPLLLPAPPLDAQTQPCESCLDVTAVVELSTADGPIVPSLHQYVVRSGEHYVVSHLWLDPQLAVYDTTGVFRRVFDPRGEGPGEFTAFPLIFHGPHDAVYAYERERLHVFDSTLQIVRTVRSEHRIASRAAALPNGWVVVDGRTEMDAGGTATVSILEIDGTLGETLEARDDPATRTVVAPATEGGFWTIPENSTMLRRYSSSAELMEEASVIGGVVEPWHERRSGEGRTVRPRPRHGDVVDLGDGTLFILALVADTEWEPRPIEGMFVPAEEDLNGVYSTVIQWVDAETGIVKGIHRMEDLLRSVGGAPGLFYSVRPTDLGHAVTTIWEVQLNPDGIEPGAPSSSEDPPLQITGEELDQEAAPEGPIVVAAIEFAESQLREWGTITDADSLTLYAHQVFRLPPERRMHRDPLGPSLRAQAEAFAGEIGATYATEENGMMDCTDPVAVYCVFEFPKPGIVLHRAMADHEEGAWIARLHIALCKDLENRSCGYDGYSWSLRMEPAAEGWHVAEVTRYSKTHPRGYIPRGR